ALDVLRSPIGPAATSPVRLTNRPAAVSPLADRIDLFWAGDDGLLQSTFSVTGGVWAIPFRLGDPAVRLHPLANIVAVNRDVGTVDVFYIGRRDGDPNWRLYNTWYIVNPIAFLPVPATQMIGGTAVSLEPMAPIAACSRSPDFIDVFAVGDNGGLHNTFWQRTPPGWSALRSVAGAPGTPTRLIGVDGCVSKTTNDVEVVATGGDSLVYGSRWNSSLPDYAALERLASIDV
ncbi:MAG TPA: hypothetical protein VE988_17280, partial [Gemmataceae bacterium]|nr:hypothetical protein [Gemmataceae bacterium]